MLPPNVLRGYEEVVPGRGADMLKAMPMPAEYDAMSDEDLLECLHWSSLDASRIVHEGGEAAARGLRAPTSCGPASSVGTTGVTTERSELAGTRTFIIELTDHNAAEATL